jgi:hypothetical protein
MAGDFLRIELLDQGQDACEPSRVLRQLVPECADRSEWSARSCQTKANRSPLTRGRRFSGGAELAPLLKSGRAIELEIASS